MERYLRITEVAERTAMSKSKVYELLNRDLPSVRIGGNRRVLESDLDAWMRAQADKPLSTAAA
jgi:excisionase family DNA binding protein